MDPTRPDLGRWRYLYGSAPTGYCSDCPGHETEDGAREHQQAYVLDNLRVRPHNPEASQRFRCQHGNPLAATWPEGTPRCDTWTSGYVEAGRVHHHSLCDEHATRAVLATLIGPRAGNTWES
jgi:hypothetical protein